MNGALQRKVTINNPNGLHMRPSAAFAELAARYQSNVLVITSDGRSLNGKSIWDLMTIGVAGFPGSEVLLQVEGPDAVEAIDALAVQLASIPNPDPDSAPTSVSPGGSG
jgi:phosphotransferase system HPr (HPr) family protein